MTSIPIQWDGAANNLASRNHIQAPALNTNEHYPSGYAENTTAANYINFSCLPTQGTTAVAEEGYLLDRQG